jgi:ribonuclease Z
MDFGEGSMGQLFRLFGHDQKRLDAIILNIKCVFISHIHADHHLGLISLLKEQYRV